MRWYQNLRERILEGEGSTPGRVIAGTGDVERRLALQHEFAQYATDEWHKLEPPTGCEERDILVAGPTDGGSRSRTNMLSATLVCKHVFRNSSADRLQYNGCQRTSR